MRRKKQGIKGAEQSIFDSVNSQMQSSEGIPKSGLFKSLTVSKTLISGMVKLKNTTGY